MEVGAVESDGAPSVLEDDDNNAVERFWLLECIPSNRTPFNVAGLLLVVVIWVDNRGTMAVKIML